MESKNNSNKKQVIKKEIRGVVARGRAEGKMEEVVRKHKLPARR